MMNAEKMHEKMMGLYKKCRSDQEIANAVKMSRTYVRKWRAANGLPPVKKPTVKKQARKKILCDECVYQGRKYINGCDFILYTGVPRGCSAPRSPEDGCVRFKEKDTYGG